VAVPAETSADRIRALRLRLGMTQEALGEACRMPRNRLIVSQLETGKNGATSYATRAQLAEGFDVPLEALAAYLDGAVSLRGILALRGMRDRAEWWRELVAAAEAEPDG
jgi:transcriptional regulator with XRE-family HTH domain